MTDRRLPSAHALSSASRLELLHLLAERGPSPVEELARTTGLHPNTVREHLATLGEADLVRREPQARGGRGRPRMVYRATTAAERLTEPDAVARTEAAVARTATARAVIDGWSTPAPGAAAPRDDAASRAVYALEAHLDAFGFDPQFEEQALAFHLWRCPVRDLARERQDVVCGVHRRLAQGVLDEAGGAYEVDALRPFVGPEHCVLTLLAPRPLTAAAPAAPAGRRTKVLV